MPFWLITFTISDLQKPILKGVVKRVMKSLKEISKLGWIKQPPQSLS